MRFVFKTAYDQDIRLFKHGGAVFWYAVLAILLLAAPALLDRFFLLQLTFVCIYAVVGVGLMLLSGYTGQISLGHAAFFAVGAYTETILLSHGWPFLLTLPAAGAAAALAGVVIGIPALRLSGIYLAIATLAFGFIVEEILARWESVTGGGIGLIVDPIVIAGADLTGGWKFYYVCLAVAAAVMLLAANLLRAPIGRAMIAIRDSEIAAQSLGVHLARTKTYVFAISAGFTGLAGALNAHALGYISPEAFTILLSIEFLLMIVVGGLGSLHGAAFGAIFVIVLPQLVKIARDWLPPAVAAQTGLEAAVFGLVVVLFMLFEPLGLYGAWRKLKLYLALFPLYRKGTFRRQRGYLKTERLR